MPTNARPLIDEIFELSRLDPPLPFQHRPRAAAQRFARPPQGQGWRRPFGGPLEYDSTQPGTTQLVPWDMQGVEYVKWLQAGLNHALRLRLAIDGDPGPATIDALQRLQSASPNQLVRLGLTGDWTDRALLKAGAAPKPAFAPPGAVGVDCDFDLRPLLACLGQARWRGLPVTFAVRYYSSATAGGRTLTRAEAEALSRIGVRCVTVWEDRALDASGSANGRTHARQAFQQAQACGQPSGTPIYFAVDYEPVGAAQLAQVQRYFEGVRDGLAAAAADRRINPGGASYEIGVYANRVALDLCKRQGIVRWFWQSCSKLTSDGANQFRWPGVSMHQVECELPLCHGCRPGKVCEARVDWNESDNHEGGWTLPVAGGGGGGGAGRDRGGAMAREVSDPGSPGARLPRASARPRVADARGGQGSGTVRQPGSGSGSGSGSGGAGPGSVLQIELTGLHVTGQGGLSLTALGGARYRALFAQPMQAVPGNVVVRVAARVVAIDAATGRPRPLAPAELAMVRGRPALSQTRAGGRSGLSSSTAHEAKVGGDGTFGTETYLGSDGSTRFLPFTVSVDLARGGALTAGLELERIDLEGFLARVDAAEQRKPAAQSNLELLASVRKIYQGGPTDPLGGLFDNVLFRSRNVAPLFAVGSPEHTELRRFQTLLADGAFVDISHVLTGIEGSPRQRPDLGQSGTMMVDPSIVVTWGGDLGAALAKHALRFAQTVATGNAPDVHTELARGASLPDLLGDVDGINVGAVYDPAKSLRQNLLAYYGTASRRRFHEFVDLSRSVNFSGRLLTLVPGLAPPRLTPAARQNIADKVGMFAGPMSLMMGFISRVPASEAHWFPDMFARGSPEMNLVVDYFAGFIEQGLAHEP